MTIDVLYWHFRDNITPTFAIKDATSKMMCRFVYDNSGGFKVGINMCTMRISMQNKYKKKDLK